MPESRTRRDLLKKTATVAGAVVTVGDLSWPRFHRAEAATGVTPATPRWVDRPMHEVVAIGF